MEQTYKVLIEETEHPVKIREKNGTYTVEVEGVSYSAELILNQAPLYSFLLNGSDVVEADVVFNQNRSEMTLKGVPYSFDILDPRRLSALHGEVGAGAGQGVLIAPMPGKVVELKVKVGDSVQKGVPILIIEAMKMQNELPAGISGVVKEIHVKPGDAVESNQKMIVIAEE